MPSPTALIREAHVLPGPYLVLAAQPLAKPLDPLRASSPSHRSLEIPSLSHVAPSGVPEPALPGFCGTASLSATPPAQAGPRGFSVGACTPPTGLPVLLLSPSCTHATANTPAEPAGACVACFPTAASLPRINGGSASALPVSRPARRSLALRPACSLSRPRRPFVIEVLQSSSLPPCTAPTASGWSDSCRAGFAPAETQRLSTAHVKLGLAAVDMLGHRLVHVKRMDLK